MNKQTIMNQNRQSILKDKIKKAHLTVFEILIKNVTTFRNQRLLVLVLFPLSLPSCGGSFTSGTMTQTRIFQEGSNFREFTSKKKIHSISPARFTTMVFCGLLRLLEGSRSPLWYLLCKHKAAREFLLQTGISKSSEGHQLIQIERGAQ